MQPHRCMHRASNGRIRYFSISVCDNIASLQRAAIISFLSEGLRNHSKRTARTDLSVNFLCWVTAMARGINCKFICVVHIVVTRSNAFIFVMVAYASTQRFRWMSRFLFWSGEHLLRTESYIWRSQAKYDHVVALVRCHQFFRRDSFG